LRYFRPCNAHQTGIRTISNPQFSTNTLSKFPGRVRTESVNLIDCLSKGVHPKVSGNVKNVSLDDISAVSVAFNHTGSLLAARNGVARIWRFPGGRSY